MDINHNLVKDLKNMGIWDKVKADIIEFQGDISSIEAIPQHLKDIYKTSFTTSPYAYIEVAARAQKWVDQALSRNMYLETRDIDETMRIYQTAWDKGLKSTYYLHMKPRHTAEQSTVSVNKAQKLGKIGFAAVKKTQAEEVLPQPFAAPLQKTFEVPVAHVKHADEPVTMSIPTVAPKRVEVVEKPIVVSAPSIAEKKSEPIAVTVAPKEQKKEEVREVKESKEAPTAVLENLKSKKYMSFEDLQAELQPKPKVKVMSVGKVCPTDPAELAQCDSCQ